MWRRILIGSALCLTTAAFGGTATAQLTRSGLVSESLAHQFGLERAWFTQVELDRGRARVAHVAEHVNSSRAHTVFEVTYDGHSESFSEWKIDAFGKMVGRENAQKSADERVAALKQQGLDATVTTRVIPEVTLYVATNRAAVHAIDGESGRTRWVASVGHPEHPTLELSANDKFLAVVNGSVLYILENDTGKLLWENQLPDAPGAGPAIASDLVFVPMINGKIYGYRLDRLDEYQAPSMFFGIGRALIQPTATNDMVCWPTDRGFIYAANAIQVSPRFRFEANKPIIAAIAALPSKGMLFVPTVDGYVYCLYETNGEMIWPFSTGEPISQSPIPVGDVLYVITDDHNMYRVSIDAGLEEWVARGITNFVAASEDRVYCVDEIGRVAVLNAKSGGRVAVLPFQSLDMKLVNGQTDRIYLGTSTGLIQCLHETQLEYPVFHAGVGELQKPKQIKPKVAKPADAGGVKPAKEENPFGATEDPFGAKKDPFGGGAPAGGEANPFGGGGSSDKMKDDAAKDENPFGS